MATSWKATLSLSAVLRNWGSWSWATLTSPAYMNSRMAVRCWEKEPPLGFNTVRYHETCILCSKETQNATRKNEVHQPGKGHPSEWWWDARLDSLPEVPVQINMEWASKKDSLLITWESLHWYLSLNIIHDFPVQAFSTMEDQNLEVNITLK